MVVNYNGAEYLIKCLAGIAAQTHRPDLVIVVDNGSVDGSIDKAILEFPDYQYFHNQANLGFAEGNNRALTVCKEQAMDFVALLNPDAFPDKDWLAELLNVATNNPGLGSIASRMMCANQLEVVDGMGDMYHMFGVPKRRGHGMRIRKEWLVEKEVFGPCAGAALYRMAALDKVGYFDSDFFCYVEDVDLAFRLQLAGYGCMYSSRAVVAHVGAAIAGFHSDFSAYHGQRNLIWTFFKNTPMPLLLLLLPGHILVNLYALGRSLARGQFRISCRAIVDGLCGLPAIWVKRIQVQNLKTQSLVKTWQILSKSMMLRN